MISMHEKILSFIHPFISLPVIGFDISDRTIKHISFRFYNSNTPQILFFGEIPLSEGIIKSGEIVNEDALVSSIAGWVKREQKKLPSRYVAASLPEEKAFLRIIQLPKIKKDVVGDAVQWEIEAHIPLSREELAYEYEIIEPIENSLDHFDVMITALPKTIVESYARALTRAGLMPVALEVESQAIIRAVAPRIRDRKAVIIVDFGYTRTSFAIFTGGAIVLTSTVALGGKDLEINIMKELGVNEKKARELKIAYGLNKNELEGKLFSALSPAISALADEIKRAAEFTKEHAKHRHGAAEEVSEILLLGGDANLFGLTTYLSSVLKIPARVADPFARFTETGVRFIPDIPKNQSLEYATAIGLAMRERMKL